MTTIVAFKDKDGIWIASDSQTISGHIKTNFNTGPKYFKKTLMVGHENLAVSRDIYIGHAGAVSVAKMMGEAFEFPKHDTSISDYTYLSTVFAKSYREFLNTHELKQLREGVAKDDYLSILIIYNNNIYCMNDFLIGPHNKYRAVGTGATYALVSMYISDKLHHYGQETVELAIESAKRFDLYSGGETHLQFIKEV